MSGGGLEEEELKMNTNKNSAQIIKSRLDRILLEYQGVFIKISAENNCVPASEKILLPIDFIKSMNRERWKKIPNCCSNCRKVYEQVEYCTTNISFRKIYFSQFKDEPWFNYDTYENLAEKVVKTLNATYIYIDNKCNSSDDDWFGDVVQYIEYSMCSFGIPSIGAGEYLGHLFVPSFTNSLQIKRQMKLIVYLIRQTSRFYDR